MNRSIVALAAVLAVAGCKKNEPVTAAPIAPPPGGVPAMPGPGAMPPPSMPPGGGMPPGGMMGAPNAAGGAAAFDQQIAMAKQIVTQDPKNVQGWVSLGNLYFDAYKAVGDRQRAQASVDAYGKALELKPNDPDVLTDQGVMYRALGQYDKAVANFEKANKANPAHVQSLYNLGVVYSSDLHQNDKAAAALNKVIQTAPASPQAAQAKQLLSELQARK